METKPPVATPAPVATTPPPPAPVAAETEAQKKAREKKELKEKNKLAREEKKKTKIQANGVTRPSSGTQTGKIWEITDALSKAKGGPIERKFVIEEALKQGLNESTAATQYGRWRKFHNLKAEVKTVTPDAAVQTPGATPVPAPKA